MVKKTIDLTDILNPDTLASDISNKYTEWNRGVDTWKQEKSELRNFLYATDTKTTSVNKNGWRNSTTRPKLTQIKDNLHANYFATLFPSSDWLKWEGHDADANTKEKAETIQSYMKTKLAQSGYEATTSKSLDDYIQYGNCFSTVVYERGFTTKTSTGEDIPTYTGPRVVRISPLDIVFDITARDFGSAPKIIRSVLSLGEVKQIIEESPENAAYEEVFRKMLSNRSMVSESSDSYKSEGFVADGFTTINEYYQSGSVELLTFYGTLFDLETETLHKERIITIVDRSYVLMNVENPSWLGNDGIFHAGWRERPDNLMAMGPLDNLVGMQYRIDHLENLQADIFDQIAAPKWKVIGDVEAWEDKPHERIYVGDEGDVVALRPDPTALNADFKIKELENSMEEMAGAPKQAMGIRTAGEKTAFEVQTLDNASGRIFQHKTAHFERVFVEPLMNAFLESARRNMDQQETIVDTNSEGVSIFPDITKEDIVGTGKLKPVGARHFAERALRLQNLQQLWQIKQGDPTVGVHLSGKMMAQVLSEELGEKDFFGENIGVAEGLDTQEASREAEVEMEAGQETLAENEI
ncbi:MAG: hypothetical protein JKY50_00075 [Oleispira sp.]|nr:hypothetical protein [Oleispira sp.]